MIGTEFISKYRTKEKDFNQASAPRFKIVDADDYLGIISSLNLKMVLELMQESKIYLMKSIPKFMDTLP